MPNEKDARKPGWREGVPIPLGDGEEWHFRKPVMRFNPTRKEDGSLEFNEGHLSLGPRFDALLNEVMEHEGGTVQFNAALNLAAYMLQLNYTLTDDDLAELLPCVQDDDDNTAMWQSIVEVALGQAPKHLSAGSAVP